jgi:hypothetical protein
MFNDLMFYGVTDFPLVGRLVSYLRAGMNPAVTVWTAFGAGMFRAYVVFIYVSTERMGCHGDASILFPEWMVVVGRDNVVAISSFIS